MEPVSNNRRQSNGSNRSTTAVLALLVIVTGLASRRYPVFGNYPGDTLWAALVYLLWAFSLSRHPHKTLFVFTVLTSFAVEVSQLFHPAWLESIRANRIGHLVLGNGFDPIDLLAYVAGAFIGMALIKVATRTTNRSNTDSASK